MEEEYGTKTFERGVLGTIGGLGLLVVLPFVGRYYDRLYRRDPTTALRLVGLTDPAGRRAHAGAVLHAERRRCSRSSASRRSILLSIAFTMVGPVLQIDRPVPVARHGRGARLDLHLLHRRDRWRAALGLLTDAFGPRAAVLVDRRSRRRSSAGFLIIRSAQFIRNDLSLVVAELQEEMEEHQRQREAPESSARAAGRRRRLLVRAGAGALRRRASRSGAARCSRCSARTARASRRSCARSPASARRRAASSACNGRNITYTTPEQRARLGIRILLGRQGRVPGHDGAARTSRWRRSSTAATTPTSSRRLDRAYDLFPALVGDARRRRASHAVGRPAADARAGDGAAARPRGARHRRAVARPRAARRPGAARRDRAAQGRGHDDHPRRAVAERRARRSPTAPCSSRRVRCASAGPAAELAERDDLARAVFLGTEGG